MSRALDRDRVRRIAKLSRLNLTETEVETCADQLSRVLDCFKQLDSIDTSAVEPLDHPLPLTNVLRQDQPRDSLDADAALANAPQREGAFFRVPRVLDRDGGA
jgi:aspartyl-tRNA(Asn)/glutamyl-tRNA(Gln) amidotransferase subunit C